MADLDHKICRAWSIQICTCCGISWPAKQFRATKVVWVLVFSNGTIKWKQCHFVTGWNCTHMHVLLYVSMYIQYAIINLSSRFPHLTNNDDPWNNDHVYIWYIWLYLILVHEWLVTPWELTLRSQTNPTSVFVDVCSGSACVFVKFILELIRPRTLEK